jgi:hypothetical protein
MADDDSKWTRKEMSYTFITSITISKRNLLFMNVNNNVPNICTYLQKSHIRIYGIIIIKFQDYNCTWIYHLHNIK